ncbi:hypothetical protein NP233_g4551 [Leucocoprinus birnbaumii]|uniref:Uncharacterized protein n=1 Tax=Leucocoprinus birnbaumii TaxID=56174 RepID=A0AAD5VVV8_9AGAR|nr:hypothetical protein NP233_g4551 [Leucocoprinus birnbaumii]
MGPVPQRSCANSFISCAVSALSTRSCQYFDAGVCGSVLLPATISAEPGVESSVGELSPRVASFWQRLRLSIQRALAHRAQEDPPSSDMPVVQNITPASFNVVSHNSVASSPNLCGHPYAISYLAKRAAVLRTTKFGLTAQLMHSSWRVPGRLNGGRVEPSLPSQQKKLEDRLGV